jgi:hypothetical protein
MLRNVLTALVLAAGLAATACIPPGTLVASDGGHRLIARDEPTGITVVLTTESWDGFPADLDEQLTVVHVLVANMGEEPILLAPGNIELRDMRGFRAELLDAGGTFRQQPIDEGKAQGYRPSREYSYDPGRSRDFGTIRTSSDDVHRAALPWGVLQPGTQMRGFLYFERLENASNRARLVWHFGTPDHRPLVDVAFDLYVARPRA